MNNLNTSVHDSPTLLEGDFESTMKFKAIPFWEGTQTAPGVRRFLPFELNSKLNHPLRQVTSEEMIDSVVSAYQASDYTFITPPPGASQWADSLGEAYFGVVKKVIGTGTAKTVLEIGGGSTWIARRLLMDYHPVSYVLVDPSVRDTAEGVDVVHDYFPTPQLLGRQFDLVLGFNVLEHVPDPLSFLCSIRKQLTSDGKAALVFPDCERQLLQGDLNVFVHEHINYFTEASSRKLVSEAGFNVIDFLRENDAFTLILGIDRAAEAEHALNELELIRSSSYAFQNLLINVTENLKGYLNKGGAVGFHGATPGLNTFFFITGLGNHPNVFLYDADLSKEGRYLPACKKCIMSPEDQSYSKNSVLVVSAITFFEQIRRFAIEKARFSESQIIPLIGMNLWC